MGFTYKVSDAVNLVGTLAKGVPLTALNVQVADAVSSEMFTAFPWQWNIATIAAGTIPLVDGVQDYAPPTQIYRMLRARIVRTDVIPNEYRDIDVEDELVPDLRPLSYTAIRVMSHEREGVGLLRLESAVQVPSGTTLEIQGEYQLMPPKITAMSQGWWFPDQYLQVAVEGLLYWVYKLADDSRAGSVATDSEGRVSYTGQYGAFQAAIHKMKEAEDYGTDEQMFPESPLGEGRYRGGLSIYGN